MKKDIKNRADIELLVNIFYEKLAADKQLGFIYREIAKFSWSDHLPGMYNFWENVILYTGNYEGSQLNLHKHLPDLRRLHATHFDKWNMLFVWAVDELFEGEKATLAKQRAVRISCIIKEKTLGYQQDIKNIY